MTKYTVQYELPCEQPDKKVRLERRKGVMHFFVPLNHPDAHTMGYMDLCAAADLSGLLHLSTPLNNDTGLSEPVRSIKRAVNKCVSLAIGYPPVEHTKEAILMSDLKKVLTSP